MYKYSVSSLFFFPATIRLINGTDQCSGRVEFYHNGQWTPAYNLNWGKNEAAVVCREMNCGDPVEFSTLFGHAGYQKGYRVSCSGTESSVTQCTLREYTKNNKDQTEEAAAICSGKTHQLGVNELLGKPVSACLTETTAGVTVHSLKCVFILQN